MGAGVSKRVFRKAAPADLPAVLKLYRSVIDHAGRTGDTARWYKYDHPSVEEVTEAVWAGHLYVVDSIGSDLSQAGLAAAGVINQRATPGYEQIPWPTGAPNDRCLVLHALGVAPPHLRQGVARFFLDRTAALATDAGMVAVRLETFADNFPALSLYRAFGFVDVGTYRLAEEGLENELFQLFELPVELL